jgi:hypothetical protein
MDNFIIFLPTIHNTTKDYYRIKDHLKTFFGFPNSNSPNYVLYVL